MAQLADRYTNSPRVLREFRQLAAAIIHHAADPDTEPQARGFVCLNCRHVFELCTCGRENEVHLA